MLKANPELRMQTQPMLLTRGLKHSLKTREADESRAQKLMDPTRSLHWTKGSTVGFEKRLQSARVLLLPLKDPSVSRLPARFDGWEGMEKNPDTQRKSRSDAEAKPPARCREKRLLFDVLLLCKHVQ